MIYFIVNPASGSGRAAAVVPMIRKRLDAHNAAYEIVATDKPDDFARVSASIDFDKAETLACVGGDGTVQEYIGLAVRHDVNFAIVPVGSGNDFIYSTPEGGCKFRSLEDRTAFYTDKILRKKTIATDAVAIKGNRGDGCVEQYFYNIGGTGIDIEVLKDAIPLKKFIGSTAYFVSLIKNAVTYRTEEITLTVDGRSETGHFLLLAVSNGAYYGGHLHIAPPARIDDGLITLCTVKKMARPKLMALFPAVKPGMHTKFKEVSFVDCTRVDLAFSGTRTINLDGNLFDYESPLTFEILKNAVRLIV